MLADTDMYAIVRLHNAEEWTYAWNGMHAMEEAEWLQRATNAVHARAFAQNNTIH